MVGFGNGQQEQLGRAVARYLQPKPIPLPKEAYIVSVAVGATSSFAVSGARTFAAIVPRRLLRHEFEFHKAFVVGYPPAGTACSRYDAAICELDAQLFDILDELRRVDAVRRSTALDNTCLMMYHQQLQRQALKAEKYLRMLHYLRICSKTSACIGLALHA